MKKLSTLILLLFLANSFLLAQLQTIDESYSNSVASPIQFNTGDTILVNCDSIFVINNLRYQFYKSMHLSLRNDADTACMSLLNTYHKRLTENEEAYELLLINTKYYEALTEDMIKDTKTELVRTKDRLQFAQESLGKASEDLKIAQSIIKKEQWKSKGRNLLFGLGGIGIGILTGILITK
jgi:hypothetical protein